MTLLTSTDCLLKYGHPETEKSMVLWDVPKELEIGVIPKKIYCNKDMVEPLTKAFKKLIETGHVKELTDWAGCFNIRKKRGASSASLHSWGVAIDLNPSHNQMGFSRESLIKMGRKPFTDSFVKCFTDAGFDWGGHWKTPDCMHFQLKK